jgi:hypothetical protein
MLLIPIPFLKRGFKTEFLQGDLEKGPNAPRPRSTSEETLVGVDLMGKGKEGKGKGDDVLLVRRLYIHPSSHI